MNSIHLRSSGPAIKALGSLFKLTEVFLWDDDSEETPQKSSCPQHIRFSYDDDEDEEDMYSNIISTNVDEDTEVTRQMTRLGLPLSFNTNKERRNGMIKGKKEGTRTKRLTDHENGVLELSGVCEGEVASPTISNENSNSLCSMPMMDEGKSSYCVAAMDVSETPCHTGGGEDLEIKTAIITSTAYEDQNSDGIFETCRDCESASVCSDGISKVDIKNMSSPFDVVAESSMTSSLTDVRACDAKKYSIEQVMECERLEGYLMENHDRGGEKDCIDINREQSCVPDLVASSHSPENFDHNVMGTCECNGESGVWRAYWDSYYMRNYFYNFETQESTWYPPPGLEHLSYNDVVDESSEMVVDKCELLETGTDNRFSGQLSNGHLAGIELIADKSVSCVAMPTVSSEFDNKIIQDINKHSSEDDFALCSLSDTQGKIGSEGKELNELTGNPASPVPSVCACDARDSFEYTNNIDEIFSNEKIDKSCDNDDDAVVQVSDCRIVTNAASMDDMNGDLQLDLACPTYKLVHDYPVSAKRKKKMRRKGVQRKLPSGKNKGHLLQAMWEECSANNMKYWCQRYSLFSKFDDGVKMDEEGWFSVTPEPIAMHHAIRCGSGVVADCFTGVGGNAIQFAERSVHVIAIDIDPKKIDYARHNAAIYGVDDHIDFINGDCFLLAPKLKADTVFLSPPWGGPDYTRTKTYNVEMLKPHDGHFLFNTAKQIASKVVMFLPRNVDINQLAELSLSANPPWSLEVERNFLNGKLKAITAYFSDTSAVEDETLP